MTTDDNSRRAYLASIAMQGLCAGIFNYVPGMLKQVVVDRIAIDAVAVADALIKELAATPDKSRAVA